MSDDRAAQAISMTAPRCVDATQWLFAGCDTDEVANIRAQKSAVLSSHFGAIHLVWFPGDTTCGAIFVPEHNGSINRRASGLLQYFFKRDGNEARIFEFDKFTHHFTARRLDEVLARTR